MEAEGTEIGLDKLTDTGTAGQPIVQEEEYTKAGTVEKDLSENKNPVGEKEPARVKEHTGQKEHRKDPDRAEENDPAKENESGRVNEDPHGENECCKDT